VSDIIDIRNATVVRGDTRVFDHLSLAIRAGEHTALLGPNGAGKSTLLKLLSRELYPLASDDCRVRLFGQDRGNVWELRSHLGIVSADQQREYSGNAPGLHVVLSGFFSSVGVWQHQQYDHAQIERGHTLMTELGIAHLATRAFGTLSTGEQRRCLLARALIHDPDMLILDEPTSGLDLKAGFQYLGLVRNLMRAGKTVLLVTHHIHEIPPEISRVVLLRNGQIFADGPKHEVLNDRNLCTVFDTALHLVEHNGFYQILPSPD